jgi:hypothetical protein
MRTEGRRSRLWVDAAFGAVFLTLVVAMAVSAGRRLLFGWYGGGWMPTAAA